MITVLATTHIAPESLDVFKAAVRQTIADSLAEDGCVMYSCSEDLTEPGAFNWVEVWRDVDAFNAHGESPHHLDLLRLLADPKGVHRSGPASGTFWSAEELTAQRRKELGFTPVIEPGHVPASA